jgi:hypothetical protein
VHAVLVREQSQTPPSIVVHVSQSFREPGVSPAVHGRASDCNKMMFFAASRISRKSTYSAMLVASGTR